MVTVVSPTVSDNCTVASLNNDNFGGSDASGLYLVGTTSVTWIVMDAAGNSSLCMQTIEVVDDVNPTITCPGDVSTVVDPGVCGANVTVAVPPTSDNCGVLLVTEDHNGTTDASGFYLEGMNVVTYTVVDVNSNVTTCSFTVDVIDDEVPTITCPADVNMDADPGSCTVAVSIGIPVNADNCGIGSLTNDFNGTMDASDTYSAGDNVVTYTAVDFSGNSTTCSFMVTINDIEDPTITCPADITISAEPGVCEAYVSVGFPMVADNCSILSVTNTYNNTPDASDTYPLGVNNVFFVVYDPSNNSDLCQVIITVEDNEDPTVTCPADITQTADNGSCGAMVTIPLPTANDNCSIDSVLNNFNGLADASDVYPVGNTAVIYVATDGSGNTMDCTFNVTITDDEAPMVVCPADITVMAEPGVCTAFVSAPLPGTSDNCTIMTVINDATGVADASAVYNEGMTVVTYFVIDESFNVSTCSFNITVTDDEAPTITCPNNIFQTADAGVCGAMVSVNAAIVNDNCSIASVVNDYTGTADGSATYPVGMTFVNYTVMDNSGNSAMCTMLVDITDNEAPVVTCAADMIVGSDPGMCGAFVSVMAPTVDDNCGVVTVMNDYTGTADASATYPVGTSVVNWTVVDAEGNTTMCAQNITVNDVEAPMLTCPADVMAIADPGVCITNVTVGLPTETDNCGTFLLFNDYNGTGDASDVYSSGINTVTFTAMDVAGNMSTCTVDVTVVDDQLPVISCPADITVSADPGICAASVTVPLLITSDNCGIGGIINNYNGGADASDVYFGGTTVVEFTVFDLGNNISTCSVNVTVTDDEAPVFTCPSDITMTADPGTCDVFVSVGVPTVTDNCSITSFMNDYTGTADASAVYGVGMNMVTYAATDFGGNVTSCMFMVNIIDNQPAVIVTCPFDISVTSLLDCEADVIVPQPDVTDNCSGYVVTNSFNGTADASDSYPVGLNTVVWTVVDLGGNTSTCSMEIEVVDEGIPAITCPSDVVVDIQAGATFVDIIDPTFGDNCAGAFITNDYNGSGSASDMYNTGTTAVTWTVTDFYGNTATCSFNVTVNSSCNPDIYEPNETFATAANFPTPSINTEAWICDGDIDWYTFNTGSYDNFKVQLLCLAEDLELEVYDETMTLIGISTNAGTMDEILYMNGVMPNKDYFIKVYGAGSTNGFIGYCLHVTKSTEPMWTEDDEPVDGVLEIVTNPLYPNPTVNTVTYEFETGEQEDIQISIIDVLGRVVHTQINTSEFGNNKIIIGMDHLAARLLLC